MIRRLSILTILLAMLVSLAACGFHLRGQSSSGVMPEAVKVLYIQGINTKTDELGRLLKRSLETYGITVLDQYKANAALLTVLNHPSHRNVLTIASNATASEYELVQTLTFNVTDANQKKLLDDKKIVARRDYQYQNNRVLAMEETERRLRKGLNTQVVQGVIRYLQAIK